jgi:hypothetical protein
MEESYSSRRLVGRRFALDLRPTRPLTNLGPIWAVVCGALASGGLTLKGQTLIFIIFLFLLCDPLLGAWRAVWMQGDWRDSLRRALANMPTWYSTTDAASRSPLRGFQVGRRLTYARQVILPLIDSEVTGMATAGGLAICVASVLGQTPLVLTIVAMLIALVEGPVSSERGTILRALYEIAFPWLIALCAFGSFSWLGIAFVVLFTLVYRALIGLGARQMQWMGWSNGLQLLAMLLLFLSNAPIAAGIAALALLAQVLWQARFRVDHDGRAYAQRIQSYVLVVMVLSGLSLWF